MKARAIKVEVALSSSGVTQITQAFFDGDRRLLRIKVDKFASAIDLHESFKFALANAEEFVWPSTKK